jgi:conjugal transfer pilus assembly protein TraF
MRLSRNIITFLSLLLIWQTSFAAEKITKNRCEEYGLGWHFYCQSEQKEEKKAKVTKDDSASQNQEDYKIKLEEIKSVLEDKKAKAVIYPTEENIKEYMEYQQMVLGKSGAFADQWRRTLWKTPALDYTLKRPISKLGKEAWIDERNKDVKQTVKQINDRYGIFFIFKGSCPYCHKYSPVLKSFQNKYGITIMAISLDGGALPEWKNFAVDNGQIERMGMEIKSVPATILFDKETRELIPVGFGMLSHTELEERIYATTKLEVGDDF